MEMGILFKRAVSLLTLSSFLMWNMAMAAPEGGQVAAGSASISQSGNTTTINQASQNAVINWNGFNTTANEAVGFVQPNSSSIALNRITSGMPTSFAGQLSANGHVWIVNPAGVLFTSTSRIDVGGLVATTLDIKNSDFMSGHYQFNSVPGFENSKVINNGTINIKDSGFVALVAPMVENNGVIVANKGTVVLASGKTAVIDLYGDELISFATDTQTYKDGKVVMTSSGVDKTIKDAINMSGVIEANNIVEGKGGVLILGGSSGNTNVSGIIKSQRIIVYGNDTKVSGELKTPDGGFIETSGNTVDVTTAKINAGQGGVWYIDPLDITIDAALAAQIMSQLNGGAFVILDTNQTAGTQSGDIAVNSPITWTSATSLTLNAARNITVNAAINNSAGGQVVLRSDSQGTGTGVVTLNADVNMTGGGSFSKIYYNPTSFPTPTSSLFGTHLNGSTTHTEYMLVNNATQWFAISTNATTLSQSYAIAKNFDASTFPNTTQSFIGWGVAGGFTGKFDGLNNEVINFNIAVNNIADAGLFSIIGSGGVVENLGVQGSIFNGNFAATNVGLLAGTNNGGTIRNSYASGSVTSNQQLGVLVGKNLAGSTITNSYAIGGVSGGNAETDNIGGFVGYNAGNISNSYFSGTTNGGGNSGGFVGLNDTTGVITNSYNQGTSGISGAVHTASLKLGGFVGGNNGSITNSYTTAATSGTGYNSPNGVTGIGGYVGNNTGTVTASFWDLTLSGQALGCGAGSCAIGIADPGVAGMKNRTTFTGAGWDFNTVWGNANLFSYPILRVNPQTSGSSIPVTEISGHLNDSSGYQHNNFATETVSFYVNNVLVDSMPTDALGNYGFYVDPSILGSSIFFLKTTAAPVVGNTIASLGSSTKTANLWNNTLFIFNNSATPATNALALTVQPVATLYTISGNNLTMNANDSFVESGAYTLNGNIMTSGTGSITFQSNLAVTSNPTLISAASVNFGGDITDAGTALTVNSFASTVAGNISGLSDILFSNANGSTTFSSDSTVTVSNSATFNGALTGHNLTITGNAGLGGATTLSSLHVTGTTAINGNASIGGAAQFDDVVNGPGSLTINGNTTFGANIGTTTPLAGLTLNGPVTFILTNVTINTTGVTNFGGGLNLPSKNFTIGGGAVFNGDITLNSLSISGNTGLLAASTNVTMGAGQSVSFGGDVSGSALTVNSHAIFGQGTHLSSLTLNNTALLNGSNMVTTGNQNYNALVTLGNGGATVTSTGGALYFPVGITGSTQSLTLSSAAGMLGRNVNVHELTLGGTGGANISSFINPPDTVVGGATGQIAAYLTRLARGAVGDYYVNNVKVAIDITDVVPYLPVIPPLYSHYGEIFNEFNDYTFVEYVTSDGSYVCPFGSVVKVVNKKGQVRTLYAGEKILPNEKVVGCGELD